MQASSRSTTARVFQQTVRLRRRTNALAKFLPLSARHETKRYSSTSSCQKLQPAAVHPSRHVVPGIPTRDQGYVAQIATPERGDSIEAWADGLDVVLPLHLRADSGNAAGEHRQYTGQDIAYYLLAAYSRSDEHFDLISHLGVVQERWQAAIWIINKMIEEGDPYERAINTPSSSPMLAWHASKSLHELTRTPFNLDASSLELQTPSIRAFVDFSPRIPDLGWTYHKGALGLVWRALGTMILKAASSSKEGSAKLMPHALEIIAVFHVHGIIPEAVYQPVVPKEPLALQQPPTLHLLSNQILTALSDAAWRAQASSDSIRSKATGAQYDFFGNEMHGTAYRGQVQQLRPEVWLELVLWSCLHGGWIKEGTSILQSTRLGTDDSTWSLINWSDELLQSQDVSEPQDGSFLSLFGLGVRSDKRNVEKTLSSELVVAYVDALVNIVRLGVGERGLAASQVLEKVKAFKSMLDKHSLGLGTMSWDAVVVRLLESEGVNAKKSPDLVQAILSLAQPFGREIKLSNTVSAQSRSMLSLPYTFEPSAATLGLLHGAIRGHIKSGNAAGALSAFEQLQAFTDSNKKRSMEEFFETLRSAAESSGSDSYGLASRWRSHDSQGFTSNVTQLAASYPNFYPQVPTALIASLLDQATGAQAYDFAKWLLYSRDADGPLVSQRDLTDSTLAPSLIRYATAVRDRALLQRVIVEQSAQANTKEGVRLASDVLKAFLESQIELRRWDSVERILGHLRERSGRVWDSYTFAVFARELLRLERDNGHHDDEHVRQARQLFTNLARLYYGQPSEGASIGVLVVDTTLGFLSSLGTNWFDYCAKLRPRTGPHPLRLPGPAFDALLQGTVHAYGSLQAMQAWQQWCWPAPAVVTPPSRQHAKVNDRGVPKIQTLRLDRGRGYKPAERTIYVGAPSENDAPYLIYNKVAPTIDGVRIIVRAASAERAAMNWEELQSSRQAYKELSQWATTAFKHVGLDDEDIVHEMESLKL